MSWLVRIALAMLLALAGADPSSAAAQSIPLPIAIERDGVLIRAEAGMDRLARETAARAGASLAAIREDLAGLPVPTRVEIRLVKRAEDLGRAAPPGRGAPPWAIGVAYPDEGVVVVAFRRGPVASDTRSVVAHELAHLALGAALGERAPRWLHEGFAYLHSSDFSLDRTRTLTGMAWTGDVIPLNQLDAGFPAREDAAARAYAESYDFVSFLARRGRHSTVDDDGNRWPFRSFLAAVARGTSLDQAARSAFAATLAQLFDEWRESLRKRYLMLPVGLVGMSVWVLAALLLVLAFWRRRRQGKATLARWEEEERGRASSAAPERGASESQRPAEAWPPADPGPSKPEPPA